jgi:isochorismate synthase
MSAEEWQARVAQAAAAVRAGTYEKLVMARAVQLQQPAAFDLVEALTRLQRDYADCAIFAFTKGGACFLGATPERLAQLQDGCLTTMSLAGSIRRGTTPAEDATLGETLLNSSKDRHEHAVVVRFIAEQLKPLMRDLQFESAPILLKLRNVQHLCTPISGQVRAGQTILDLVECLHPTPAVGGRPRKDALQFIRDVEGLDRGWYAAPVGWIDAAGEGEFVVALRSALVNGNVATLFAGCGIVGDSEPEREYLESSLKLRPMTMALT